MTGRRRICLLGGSGFVGTRLAARLVQQGREVIVPTRDASAAHALRVLPAVQLVEANPHDPGVLDAVLADCTVAVNLVGILNERGRDGAGFRAAHTQLAEKLVAAAARQRVGKLVQLSALGADAVQGPSHYLRTKGEAERAIRSATCEWTILQPSVIFGPGDSFTNRFAGLLRLAPAVFPLAMGGTRFAPVHVDDVVTALLRAIDDPATSGHVYPLCGSRVLTLRDIVTLIAAEIGVRRRIIALPRPISRLQAALCDFLPGKPFSTDNFLSLTRDSVCTENGCTALGITARPFEPAVALAPAGALSRARLDTLRRQAGRRGR